jgi:hypothetical protein
MSFRRKASSDPHLTLALCVSPFGDGPPPAFIFPTTGEIREFAQFERAGKVCVLKSPNGWLTSDAFSCWAAMFVEWLDQYRTKFFAEDQERAAILFMDNCRAHCNLSALRVLADHNCKVISFPPHMSHIMQPVDVSCVAAFKAELGKNLEMFSNHPEYLQNVTSEESRARAAIGMASLSCVSHCSVAVCCAGFEQCGLRPWSPQRVLTSRFVHQSDVDPELADRMRRPEVFHCGSSVMTSPEFLSSLNEWLVMRNVVPEQ